MMEEPPYGYCHICGNKLIFDKKHPQKKYCSQRCRWKAWFLRHQPEWRKERNCLHCGKTFLPKYEKHKYCSSNCQKYEWAINNIPKRPKRIKLNRGIKRTKECPICNKPFESKDDLRVKFCSRKCAKKSLSPQRKIYYKKRRCDICDAYIAAILKIPKNDIPDGLTKVYREYIKLRRMVREINLKGESHVVI